MMIHSKRKKVLSFALAMLMLLSTAAPAFADVFAFVTTEDATPVFGAGTLTADYNGYTVSVAYDEAAKIPEGAELQIYEYVEGTLQYDEYLAAAEEKTLGEDEQTVFARFFDITICYTDPATGETVKVEPAAPVAVEITSAQLTEAENVTVVHFPETAATSDEVEPSNLIEDPIQDVFGKKALKANKGMLSATADHTVKENAPVAVLPAVEDAKLEIMDSVVFESGVISFTADGFSVYGIVGTSVIIPIPKEGGVFEKEENGILVNVTVPDGAFFEDVELSVVAIPEGSEAYATAVEELANIDQQYDGMVAYDIHFYSVENPEKEVEPALDVKVEISVTDAVAAGIPEEEIGNLTITHIFDEGGAEVVKGPYALDFEDGETENEINELPVFDDGKIGEFDTGVFSTYTISWGNRSYDVHYVDTNGNSLTPTRTPEFSNGYKFLIYDVDGYEYDSTHYGSRTGTAIKPLLANYGNDRVYLDNNNNWQYLRNDIYVVYKAKDTPTTGGTPQVDQDETWPDQEDPARKPQFTKSSTNVGNGTNNISLTITAPEKPVEKSTPADVIVVFDVSGSMDESMSGQTRLDRAKTAVNNMANTLLNGQNSNVRMALISFSTTAQQVGITGATEGFTSNYANFSRAVNGLSASGGTNWENALKLANQMPVRSDAATFVVFVTDGDPTFRISRGNVSDSDLDLYTGSTYQYYRNNYIFGTGSSDNEGYNFDFAVEQVKAIAGATKNFYAIGISNDVTKVQTLTTEGGVAADHAFIASNNTAMENAFKSITESIKSSLGFGNVEVTDGITALTNAEMKVMQSVDPTSFKYYRYGGANNKYGNGYANKTEWTTRAADGCAAATYDSNDGAVHWDMGELFQLEDGVTYVVEFTVWPSQAAYDLVADLNNGIKTFADLTPEEKAQVVEVTPPTETTTGTYALKTNTDEVSATYNRTTKTGDTVTVSDTTDVTAEYHAGTIQNMSLDSDYITVKKEWHNALDSRVVDGITLTVTKDDVAYLDDLTLNDDNNWTSDEQYISAGVITKSTNGRYNVREKGHEYTVTEPASFSYYWDLTADTYRPMVIEGTLTMLIKTDDPSGTEGTDYYVIEGKNYQVSSTTTPQLTAANDRRSNLNLKKIVTANTQAIDKVPDPDDVFTYTITVTDVNGDAVWFGAQDETGATVLIESYSPNVTPEVDASGNPTGSYSVPSGATFTISIKAGWNVRFFNLPRGTTYSIQETGMEDGYEFVKAETSAEVTKPEYASDFVATPGTVSGNTVTGTIDQPNNVYSTEYTNNWNPNNEIVIIKNDENGTKLAGAQFKLSKMGEEDWTQIATFTSNAAAGETLKVGHGLYKLEETAAPTNYAETDTVYFKVVTNGNTTTVALTDEEGEEKAYPDATASGNEVTIKDWPLTTAVAHKAWKNADGTAAAPAGASVVYTLYQDNVATNYTVTLDGTADTAPTGTDIAGYERAGWTATFVNLPKYKIVEGEAVEITYTIAETTTYSGYTASTTEPVANGGTVTNSQEATTANAIKAWVNADGSTTAPANASVVYTLYANGTATNYTVTLDGTVDTTPTGTAGYESAAWKAEFINLPKYKIVEGASVEITYTIAETTTYPGYTPSTTDAVASGETITNTQGSTETFALKAWKNADGTTTAPQGGTVTYTLYANGEATSYTVTLDGTVDSAPTGTAGYESEAWKATFVNLPQYQAGTTTEIVYTIAETTGYPGYTASTTAPVASGSTITNTQDPTTANALKAWKNADGTTTAPQGGTVTYTLYADGEATNYTVNLDGTVDSAPTGTGGYESAAWKAEFVNLAKYKIVEGAAVEIVYTIGETTTYPGYTASSNAPVASGATITNTQEPTTANALKAWKNADGTTAAPTGASVVYTLYQDGEATTYTVTLDGTPETTVPTVTGGYESEAWKAMFVNLPKSKIVNGEEINIVYTIEETTTYPGYMPSTTDPVASGATITNTQEDTEANALKAWKNADGMTAAPTGASVVYTLYQDGEATTYTVTLDGTPETTVPTVTGGYESEAWKAMFVNLPKSKIVNGEKVDIVYTIEETTTYPGYTPSTTDPVASGETITNTQEATSANATKAWKNADGSTTAPEGATVVYTLYADGNATSYTVTLDGTADTEPAGTAGYEIEGWKAAFINLPKYQAGTTTAIVYTIAETTTYPGYTASTTAPVASGATITNTQEPTTANALKAWKNADGTTTAPQGGTVTYTLYADGEATNYTVNLDGTVDSAPTGTGGYESAAWKAEFINLPKYQKGTTTAIVYTIKETTTYPGYTPSTTDAVASGETITNTQGSTETFALKVWKNADGTTTAPQGGTVTYTLYADGTVTNYTVILDGNVDTKPDGTAGYESEAWKATFVNLPQYQAGTATPIVYTIAESTGYPGYTADTTEPVGSGSTITNTQNSTTANAIKAWVNADGTTDAPQGGQVTYTLYADGTATSYTVTLDGTVDTAPTVTGGYESEAWKAEFINLPKYKVVEGEAVEITYTIAESTTYPGYTPSTTAPVANGGTITNTQEETSANALKAWKNADGTTAAPTGASVVYTLYQDGVVTTYTVTLDGTPETTVPTVTGGYESEAWKAEFVHLPKYKIEDGAAVEINYTIAETTVYPGYTASTTDPVASGSTITNTQEATSANAAKEWKNADGTTAAPTGASVVYTLYQDGEPTTYNVTLDGTPETTVPTVTGGYESEAWKAMFVNLPKSKIVDGEAVEIKYTIAETTTYPGYTASTTDPVANGGTITNTQDGTAAEATKEWKNADGTDTAPTGASVVYTLYADGKATEYSVTLDGAADTEPAGTVGYESEGWKATFVNLPKYQNGTSTEIVYTIAETTTYPGYMPSTTDPVANGGTITNTQEDTSANALKAWKNADGTTAAPTGASVVYTLYQDGVVTTYTVTLDGTPETTVPTVTGGYESEAWKAEFVHLPKYKIEDGAAVEINYTIAETTVYPGYTASTTDPVASGSTIINTQEETYANALKAWKNADGTTEAPQGGQVTYTLYADGNATDYTVTLDGTADTAPTVTGGYESEAWKAEFVHLPKYQAGTATPIVYTIAETTGYPGYTASTTSPVASGETITNTQDGTAAEATKEWKNADGSTTPPQGGQVTYTLYADNEPTNYTVTLDGTPESAPEGTGGHESESWKATFVNLPKYKIENGAAVEIVYTIGESVGYPGYTASMNPVASGRTITNEQDKLNVNALKAWKNADGTTTPPTGATVVYTLYADGTATDYTVTLDGTADATVPTGTAGCEIEAWKAMFLNLPKYKIAGGAAVEIAYTIAETTMYPGYTASTTDAVASGETITNTQEAIEAEATKAWMNADGTTTAPEGATVVFTLYADDAATEYTVTLDGTADETVPTGTAGYESEAWKAMFVHLPKYQADGTTEIVYTIAETTGYTGYKASTTEPVASEGSITNSQLYAKIKLLKIGDETPTKKLNGAEFELYTTWNGAGAADNVKAKNINGEEVETIRTENEGVAMIGGLLPGTYYLVETKAPAGYNMLTEPVTIIIELDNSTTGYHVTYNQPVNAESIATGDVTPDTNDVYEIVVNNPSGKELPHTGFNHPLAFTIAGITMLTAVGAVLHFRKKDEE